MVIDEELVVGVEEEGRDGVEEEGWEGVEEAKNDDKVGVETSKLPLDTTEPLNCGVF